MLQSFVALTWCLGLAICSPSGGLLVEEAGALHGHRAALLVVNKSDHTLSIIDLERGVGSAVVPTGFGPHEVAASADGRFAYVSDYGTGGQPGSTVTVIDLVAEEPVGTIDLAPHTRPHGITVASDGTVWVTTEGSKHLLQLDPGSRRILREIETGQEVTHMVALAEGQDRIFTANIGSGTATAIRLSTGEVLRQIRTGEGAEGIAVTPDGQFLLVANRAAGTLSVIRVGPDEIIEALKVGNFPIRVAVTPDGETVLVSNAQDNEVAVVEVGEWTVRRRIPVGETPVGLLIHPDGKRAYVANTRADQVTVLDLEAWREAGSLVAGREPDGLAYAWIPRDQH